jgi:hypothetical protein
VRKVYYQHLCLSIEKWANPTPDLPPCFTGLVQIENL